MDMYSIDAMYLMSCTALVESKLTHLKQLPDGPALGFMQVEPDTYFDVIRYLNIRDDIGSKVLGYCNYTDYPLTTNVMIHNLAYNAMIARVKYWMQPQPIPSYKDSVNQAEYYELYFNGNPEVNKVDEFVRHSKNVSEWIVKEDSAHD